MRISVASAANVRTALECLNLSAPKNAAAFELDPEPNCDLDFSVDFGPT
jgi:hypothetical protein